MSEDGDNMISIANDNAIDKNDDNDNNDNDDNDDNDNDDNEMIDGYGSDGLRNKYDLIVDGTSLVASIVACAAGLQSFFSVPLLPI